MAIKWRKKHEYSHPHHLQNKIWLYLVKHVLNRLYLETDPTYDAH